MENEFENEHSLLCKGLSHAEAVALAAALEGSGISAILKTENLGGHIPGGVNNYIFVRNADLERARDVIEIAKENSATPTQASRTWRPLMIRSLFVVLLVVAVIFGYAAGHLAGYEYSTLRTGKKAAPPFGKVDSDQDGVTDTNVYANEQGGWVEETDHNGDGKADSVFEYAEDTGAPVRSREDANLDGKFDSWTEYNSNGEKSRREEDRNFDGVADALFLFENGLPSSGTISDKGKVIDRTEFKNGHQVRSLVDTDRDGTLETEILFDEFGVFRSAKRR